MSPEFRVHFEGGSGLQTTIPLDRSLGPARLQQLYLELAIGTHAGEEALRFESSLGAQRQVRRPSPPSSTGSASRSIVGPGERCTAAHRLQGARAASAWSSTPRS